MINFFDLDVNRVIVHRILEKEPGQSSSQTILSENLLNPDENIIYTILERLSAAVEKKSKAFELVIGDVHDSSFFGYAHELPDLNNEEFIVSSQKITQIIADAQISSRIPGGYLIIMDCIMSAAGKKVIIAIKAEQQDALTYVNNELHLLENVFMSPYQKLFKFGLIYEMEEHQKAELEEGVEYPNDTWSCILYDDQFRPDSKPAEYFYKDFLGFSIDNNPSIQTKKFYDKTENFIKNYYDDFEEKKQLIDRLNDDLLNETLTEIDPKSFAENNFSRKKELEELYNNEVVDYLPYSIPKDNQLIRSNLNSKKINFPSNIKLSGPSDSMDTNVEIITSNDQLNNLNVEQSSYTLIKVAGKPYNKD